MVIRRILLLDVLPLFRVLISISMPVQAGMRTQHESQEVALSPIRPRRHYGLSHHVSCLRHRPRWPVVHVIPPPRLHATEPGRLHCRRRAALAAATRSYCRRIRRCWFALVWYRRHPETVLSGPSALLLGDDIDSFATPMSDCAGADAIGSGLDVNAPTFVQLQPPQSSWPRTCLWRDPRSATSAWNVLTMFRSIVYLNLCHLYCSLTLIVFPINLMSSIFVGG